MRTVYFTAADLLAMLTSDFAALTVSARPDAKETPTTLAFDTRPYQVLVFQSALGPQTHTIASIQAF